MKKNHYVVWEGHIPGIYSSWTEAGKQVNGFRKARFKGFHTRLEAELAFARPWEEYIKLPHGKKSDVEGEPVQAPVPDLDQMPEPVQEEVQSCSYVYDPDDPPF